MKRIGLIIGLLLFFVISSSSLYAVGDLAQRKPYWKRYYYRTPPGMTHTYQTKRPRRHGVKISPELKPARALTSNEIKGLRKIFTRDQKVVAKESYFVDFINFRNVFFVTVENLKKPPNGAPCSFYLVRGGKIIYKFSDLEEIKGYEILGCKAVSFRDMNRDGRKDVTVILEAVTGVGPTGAIPFPVGAIYFNRWWGFGLDPAINREIQELQLDTIWDIYNFMRYHVKRP